MTTNVSYALAIKLSTSASLSTEERLFRQALSQVEDKTSRGGVRPAIFDILQHAQSIEDLKYALDSVRRSNKFWTEDVGKTWLKNLSKYAEQILVYKGLLGSVTARIGADVASPIWGTFEFILSIFKDVASTVSKLENIERTLKASISRFSRYFTSNLCASSSVQGALVEYYEIVISFAVETHGEFQASRSRTVFNAVHRTLNAKLTDLSDKIQRAIDDVDKGARIDRDERSDRHMEILNGNLSLALAQYASGRSSPQPPATRTIQNLPNRTNHFSGRRDYLSTIWKAFQRQNNCQACTAVYGMPGIGKTQLIQKYAYDQFHGKFRRIIVYIDASSSASISSNVLTFMQSYAPDLLLNASNGEQHFSTFHAWLSNQDDWLLVLDNIRDYNDVQKLLPRGQQGQILCSTRERMLAEMLAHENTIEIMPMSKLESKTFIAKLTECSNISEDKTDSIHDLVADFAKGVPLYIEQIVHNAIFGHKSIRTTLSQVAEKTALLRQKNLSSLHEDNLSLGGMIMQAFETIKARSDKAEALFGILAYLQPSAIPLQLIREGSKEYQSFLTSSVTYNRGARRLVNGNPQISFDDRPPSLVKPESESKSKSSSRLRNWSSRLVRSKNATIETDLLVDDADLRKALSTDFGPNTPYGRLFENRDTIDSAILTLCNAAVIRHTDFETLWMHDLVSEVARALIESNSCVVGQQILRTSSIMVYLSLPHPESLYILNNLASSRKYLPHALVCHQEMKNAGILNDSSIGPELSHLIASILSKNLTRDFQVSGERCTQEERVFCDERILDFYTQAYHGYMAGWARLKSRYGISDKQIHHLTTKDRDAEVAFNMFFKGEEYSKETNRFGRAAPWRAIQTAARLYVHLEDNMQRYSEAQHWLQIVLDFCEMVFGPLDEETEYFRSCMTSLLGHYKGDYESAYNLNLVPVAKILQCKVSDLGFDRLQNVEFTPLLQTAHGLEYIDTAGSCALNQARKCRDKSDRASKLVWARVALFWLKIKLRETRAFYRDSLYVLSAEMKSHAYAYELWEKSRTSMYYFAQAIVCTFDTTGPLAEECGPAPSVKLDNIKLYKEAKIRLYGEAGLAGLAVWDDDPELKELIGLCDAKANAWKDSYQSSPSEVAEKEEAIEWSAILVQHSGLEDCASIEDRQEVELGEEKENVRPENI